MKRERTCYHQLLKTIRPISLVLQTSKSAKFYQNSGRKVKKIEQ